MQAPASTVVAGLEPSAREIVARLRRLIREEAPELLEEVTADRLEYGLDSSVCFIRPTATHVELGFARGKDLAGVSPLGTGPGARAGAIKLHRPEDVWPELFRRLVRQAVALARWGAPRVERWRPVA